MRDALPELAERGVSVVGISRDKPHQQKSFDEKHGLGIPLLSDADNAIAEDFGVWGEKKVYGKTTMGIVRSAFLIDEKGRIAAAQYNISPNDTVPSLRQWLMT